MSKSSFKLSTRKNLERIMRNLCILKESALLKMAHGKEYTKASLRLSAKMSVIKVWPILSVAKVTSSLRSILSLGCHSQSEGLIECSLLNTAAFHDI